MWGSRRFTRYARTLPAPLRFSFMMNDSDWPTVAVKLNAAEASKIAEVLRNLAGLIDADDPEGLRDANGQRADEYLLTDMQFRLLRRRPLYNRDDRAEVASNLRIISARVEGQLPGEAPEIGC